MDELILPLTDADFRFVSDLVYDTFGIKLSDQKRSLVASRLSKRVRQLGYLSFRDYFGHLKDDRSGAELSELINRVTTNHSYFFRESDHFDVLLKDILPGLVDAAASRVVGSIRIWSAGCAAGEEPYTLAMLLLDVMSRRPGGTSVDAGILATDVSLSALLEAKTGVYGEARLKELPKAYRLSYLKPAGPELWAVSDAIKSKVLFKRLNLMNQPYPFKSQFDVVFCRNVMIYFDPSSRAKLIEAIYSVVKPGGWFFIGHSESLPRDTCPFSYVRPATYRKELS